MLLLPKLPLSFDVMNFQTISKLKNSNLHMNMQAIMCKYIGCTFHQTKKFEAKYF